MTDAKDESVTLTIEKSEFKELIAELRIIRKALAASKIRFEVGTEKNARFLRVFGLTEQEIADLLGVSQPTVHEALSKKGKSKE